MFPAVLDLCHTHPGIVYGYADGVAWGNNKDKEPTGVIVMDLTSDVYEDMKRFSK